MIDITPAPKAHVRTTLAIDDDVLLAARHLAERQGRSMGEVISTLARQGLQGDAPRKVGTVRNGVPLLHGREGSLAVTLDMVNQLRDEQP